MDKKVHWIGIGASAGGLEALKELLSGLDTKNAIYIIAQHLDPKHPTILKDLLNKITDIKINMIEEDTKPVEGEIYIISPGHNAIIQDKKIILKPAALVGPKPSINEFFTSLANEIEDKSIGIILSGTGSDGAQGIVAIKAAGGIAFCQDEISAKYSGMPNAAAETGVVDFILPPNEIAKEIKGFLNLSIDDNQQLNGPKVRSNLEKIFQRLYDQTNYDFSGYKLKTIQRRIQRRMVVNKVITLDDYLTLLMSSSTEVENLFKELLISVTSFFRDEQPFEDLAKVIEELVKSSNPGESLRIWVPGCARGEEAYSIAILVQEAIYKLNKEVQYQIFATDIDDNALNKARQGTYTHDQIEGIKPDLVEKYFNRYQEYYIVSKALREHMVFAKQNLIMDPPFSNLDLISCRNVMIYFNLDTQKKVFATFHFALKNNGYLFLGKSESAANSTPELFEAQANRSHIFKRRLTNEKNRSEYLNSSKTISTQVQSKDFNNIKTVQQQSIKEKMEKALIDQAIPTSVVINSQGQMLHVRGNINRFLSIPEGKVDNNILSMAQESLKIDIRALMQKAKRGETSSAQALFYEHEKDDHILYLMITKLDDGKDDLYVVAFFDLKLNEGLHPKLISGDLKNLSSEELQQEVEVFKERLQSSISDLETTNEELQSTNEELQSANEELQSANEELQTANEELQSTNEELSTVNEELEVKTFELYQVNNDLESMLTNIDEIIIFVDTRLRIQRYTNKAATTFDLNQDDIGQVITSYDLNIEIPNLRLEILSVIESEQESTISLRNSNLKYDLRLVSYKSDNEVVGVIMFFERLSVDHKEYETTHYRCLEILGENTSYAMIAINNTHEISFANENFSKLINISKNEVVNKKITSFVAQKSLDDHFFSEETKDNEGWLAITLQTQQDSRITTKYKVIECVDKSISEKIIFFEI
jgi:two-component system CheB/CheR fusion protein